MVANSTDLEKRLWDAADELRANSKLRSSEYSVPVLGLIFLRYADHKFTTAQAELEGKATGRRAITAKDYQARGVLYLPEQARFSALQKLPEGADIGKAISDAMRAIEADNDELRDVLPKTYNVLDNTMLVELIRTFSRIPMDIKGCVREDLEEQEVKKVAQDLLAWLKREKLVLDWRKRQQSTAAVWVTIEEQLDRLPPTYTPELFAKKCNAVYQHVYDSYYGAGGSVYS